MKPFAVMRRFSAPVKGVGASASWSDTAVHLGAGLLGGITYLAVGVATRSITAAILSGVAVTLTVEALDR